jgi:hypothetical protein
MPKLIWGARVALPVFLLAACSGDPAPPGAATADEERQLNEAAAMLDANSVMIENFAAGATDEDPQ